MKKYLKLVGLATYAGKAVRGSVINRNDICCFGADVADQLLQGHNSNAEGEPVPYWREVSEDAAKSYLDFSDIKLETVTNASRRVTRATEEAGEGEGETPAPVARTATRRSTGQRATARA